MDGILVVNKPKGYTSHDVVSVVKSIYREKVGHTGTLDPNATGILPLLIGQATKLSYYLTNHDKAYEVTLELGKKTDTADCEGKVIEERNLSKEFLQEKLSKENLEKILTLFLGEQKQVPPMYSAIKVKGKKLYEYARQGKEIAVEPRNITIYEVKIISIDIDKKEIMFQVKCSKGTYIRSLCEDIAEKLGTIGYMKELNRMTVGDFTLKDAVDLETLKNHKEDKSFLEQKLLSIEDFFKSQADDSFIHLQEIRLPRKKLELFLNGVKLSYPLKNGLYRIYFKEGSFIGVGRVEKGALKREIIVEK